MKAVLLFFLMIIAAVFLGLAIAFWYLSRFTDNTPARKPPRAMPFPEKHPPVDVTPTSPELLEHRGDAAATPNEADVDGLMRRLAAIEEERELRPSPADKAADQQPQPFDNNRDGEKDDLKRISGIGPKLERMLNTNGIFSFRQIAAWQEADIEAIDKLLPAFHGRIQREDWVGQARGLRADKGTAGEN